MKKQTNRKWLVAIPLILGAFLSALLLPESFAQSQGPFQRLRSRFQQRFQQQQTCANGICDNQTTVWTQTVPTVTYIEPALPALPSDAQRTSTIQPIPDLSADIPIEVAEPGLRRSLLKAINDARKNDSITVRDAIKLRVASFSPAFIEKAEELAIVQMAMSEEGETLLVRTASGEIDKTAIDWDGLAGFLEAILPLLLQLLKAFGI